MANDLLRKRDRLLFGVLLPVVAMAAGLFIIMLMDTSAGAAEFAALGIFLVAIAVAFPDVTRSIDQIMADEDRVVVRFTLRGTHNGPFGDIPPKGNRVEVTANIIYRIANGRIVESWVEADLGTFVRSLVAESGQQ